LSGFVIVGLGGLEGRLGEAPCETIVGLEVEVARPVLSKKNGIRWKNARLSDGWEKRKGNKNVI
jgi:hypothetical protein